MKAYKITRLGWLALCSLLFAAPTIGNEIQQLTLNFEDKLKIEEHYQGKVERVISNLLPKKRFLSEVNVFFDELKIKTYNNEIKDIQRQGLKELEGAYEQRLREMKQTMFDLTGEKQATFGKLNIDMNLEETRLFSENRSPDEDKVFQELLKLKSKIIQIERGGASKTVYDFIKQVVVQVTMEENIPQETVDLINRSIIKALHLDMARRRDIVEITSKEIKTTTVIPHDPSQDPKPVEKTFWEKYLPLLSPSLITFTAICFLGLTIMLTGILMIRQLDKIKLSGGGGKGGGSESGESIGGSSSGGGGGGAVASGGSAVAGGAVAASGGGMAGGDGIGMGSGIGASRTKSMASETVEQLREKIGSLFSGNKGLAVEMIRDLIFVDKGLEYIRGLIDFLGFNMVEEMIMALPRGEVKLVKDYLEQNAGRLINPDDIESAISSIYQGGITKVLNERVTGGSFFEERSKLMEFSDEAMIHAFGKARTHSCAALLPLFSRRHIAHVIKSLDMDRAVDILIELQKIGTLKKETVVQSVTEIEGIIKLFLSAKDWDKIDVDQFMIGVMQEMDIDNEGKVFSALPREKYGLKRKMRKLNFPFKDLVLFPLGELKAILDSFTISMRAELIFTCPDEIGQRFLSVYSGSQKVSDMLYFELEGIKNNPSKRRSLKKRRQEIQFSFLDLIRGTITDNPDLLIHIDREEYTQSNWDIPADLQKEIDDVEMEEAFAVDEKTNEAFDEAS